MTPTVLVNQEQKNGDLFFNHFNYSEAAKHYLKMIEASRKLGIYRNLASEADVQRKLANCFEMMGNYDQALLHVREAVKLDSLENNILARVEDYRQEGKILIYSGQYLKGIKSLEKSLSLSEGMDQSLKNDHRLTIADTYLALGQLFATTGKLTQAQTNTNDALRLFLQADDKRGQMESMLTLGSIFFDLGDNDLALSFAEKSLRISFDLLVGTARQYQLLATIFSATGDFENAVRSQLKAVEDAEVHAIIGQMVWANIGMGDVYRDVGDLNRALRYYKKAQTIRDTSEIKAASLDASVEMRLGSVMSANKYFASEGSISGEAITSMRIAEIMMQNEKNDSALIFLQKSGRLFRESGNWQGRTNIQMLTGKTLIDKGEYKKAKPFLDSACTETDYPDISWQAFFQMGRMFENQNQRDEAIKAYRNSITVIEKVRSNLTVDEFKSSFLNNKREVYDRLIRLLLQQNNPVEAFLISEQAKARSFYDILAGKKINFRSAKPGDMALLEQEKRMELQKKYMLLQKGISVPGGSSRSIEADMSRAAVDEAQSEYEEVIQKLKLSDPSYSVMVTAQPVDMKVIQSVLDSKSAIISYWTSDDNVSIWLLTNKSVFLKSAEMSENELTSLIEKTRKAIKSLNNAETISGLKKLYSLLFAPLENSLAGISNLTIIPNGSLHFLPFQALMDNNGNYLVQKYNFTFAPSAGVFYICKSREVKPGSRFLGSALGDIDVGNYSGLPGTEDELKRILPLFEDKISAVGKQSSETFVRKNAGGCSYIHLATHGSYNSRHPLYSYLLFPPSEGDDGRLNVYEVFEMPLDARLITLSACETGLGSMTRGDELTGLSRAFLYAGSSSVIVSLWAVADYPTALLMTSFYMYIKTHTFQEALTLAQRDVIKVFPQPLYWSPFILIGNGDIISN